MAGVEIGVGILSSAFNVLFDRLAPQGELLKIFQKNKHDVRLLEKLRWTLLGLQDVLSDAENKQASSQRVSQWLNELRDAVDGAENLIEEVNYKALRLKVEGQHQNLAETGNPLEFFLNMKKKFENTFDEFFLNIKEELENTIERLEVLEKQIGHLDLTKYRDSGEQEKRVFSTSVVVESEILGRQNEIEELVGRLLSVDANGKNLTVIPIVGMAGVGKTRLANAIYNDERVNSHFNLKAWICVSEAYDAFRITKELLQEIGLGVDNNLNQLQVKLKESLKGKKFLFVLDDVWNESSTQWDDLKNLFLLGDVGSKIIVTTRKRGIALMMGGGEINMGTLSSEVSWSLLKRHAFQNLDPEEHPELEEVGRQIAAKCNGLPLALKTLAAVLLRSKSDVEVWKRILRSEIWKHPDNDILAALKLSYNDLPAHLKRCFSYCAIFPKDYPFCREQVIQLWIANGLVQRSQEYVQIEDLGNEYFDELQSRSLFEMVPNSSKGNTEKFLMHDLVNDLAQIASSKLCIRLEESQESHVLKSRHLSYLMGDGDFEKLKPLDKLEQLRTLLPISFSGYLFSLSKRVLHNILPTLRSLRALSLSHYEINELPDALFIKLKLLRFLDLSCTEIKKLPYSICALYNLDTLLLSHCSSLEELPQQMERLINLRHLDISGTRCLKMSLYLSKLKSLHVLVGAEFLLGDCIGLRIVDLGELSNLYGSLSILELQNVVDRREAQKANMREKNHVEKLSLNWSESIANNSQTERDILDELKPSRSIKELQIAGYRGTNFPNWLADHSFLKLVEFSLSNCKFCFSLPPLGQLPSLKFLAIRGMHLITKVTEEFYGSSSSKKPFNSLEKLEFAEMPEWKQWHVLGKGEFPTLHELSIEDCPKLIGKLPDNLCSLTRLTISKCPELTLETPIQLSNLKEFNVVRSRKVGVLFYDAELFTSQLQGMKQIVKLSIAQCWSLTSLPISILSNTLKTINISHCGKLKLEASVGEMFLERLILHGCELVPRARDLSLNGCELVPRARDLSLNGCDPIDDISHEWIPRARDLSVRNCHSLKRLLIPTGTETLDIRDCRNIERLTVACGTQMTSLYIYKCEKLKWLPERMQELLPSLKELRLWDCPEIESFPEGGLPFNLEGLMIYHCKKLVNNRKEWRLQRLPCLRKLQIFHDGSDEEILVDENWELPCSIRRLTISNLTTLSSQVLKSLTSLESLSTGNLPQIQSLLEEGLPSSLSKLELRKHDELHSLPMEGLLRLTSLQRLEIYDCPNLQSTPESALPSSLSVLTIKRCPNLQSLPVKGMPSSLSYLSIFRCPLLKQLLEFEKGKYWPNIAQIPTIWIEWQSL